MAEEERRGQGAKAPENMVVYDPERAPKPKWHACVVLRKVNDALHNEEASPAAGESGEYEP